MSYYHQSTYHRGDNVSFFHPTLRKWTDGIVENVIDDEIGVIDRNDNLKWVNVQNISPKNTNNYHVNLI